MTRREFSQILDRTGQYFQGLLDVVNGVKPPKAKPDRSAGAGFVLFEGADDWGWFEGAGGAGGAGGDGDAVHVEVYEEGFALYGAE